MNDNLNRLIFVRHGVRGLKKLGEADLHLPFFGLEHILSLYGHIHSLKMGKYIKKRYGVPTLIYPDNDSERTIHSAIAIAKGSSLNRISLAKEENDPFFIDDYLKKKEDIEEMRAILSQNKERIEVIKKYVADKFPFLHLKEETEVTEDGLIHGLLNQLNILCQIPSFSSLSLIPVNGEIDPLLIENSFSIKQPIKYPSASVQHIGSRLWNGILHLLKKEKLTVIVGHDSRHLGLLASWFQIPFSAPDYALGYIPANSGFIFTLDEDIVKIEILYITREGKFKTTEYKELTFSSPQPYPFDLVERFV